MSYTPQSAILDNQIAKIMKVSPMREAAVSDPIRLVGTAFFGALRDANFWAEVVTGSAVVTQGNAQISMSTGITANSEAQWTSVRTARYVAGAANFFRGVIRIPDAGVVSNTRRWGAFTPGGLGGVVPQNGVYDHL